MRSYLLRWRVMPVFALMLLLALPIGQAFGQDAGAVISVDRPGDGQTAELGQDVVFGGWAAEWGSMGTGIDRVVVYDAPLASGGQVVAEAVYGAGRTDVAAAYDPAWLNSEFTATWRANGAAGNRTFWIYAHSMDDNGWTNKTVTIRLIAATEAAPAPAPVVAQPTTDYRNPMMGQNPYAQQNRNDYPQMSGQYPSQYPGQLGGQYGPNGMPMNGQYAPYANGGQYGAPYGGQYAGQYGAPYGGQFGNPAGYPSPVVSANAGNDGMIILNWIPVQSASQYRIYELSPTSALVNTVSQTIGGMTSSTVISGLTVGSSHAYQVRAVSANGTEIIALASSMNSTGAIASGFPSVTVTVSGQNASSVSLSWIPSQMPGITRYDTSQSLAAAGPFTPSVTSGSGATGTTVQGLLPNTTYYFQVAAVANNTANAPSATVSAATTF